MENLLVEDNNKIELLKLEGKTGQYYNDCLDLARLLASKYPIKVIDLYGVSISAFFSGREVIFVYNTRRETYSLYRYSKEEGKYVKYKENISLSFSLGGEKLLEFVKGLEEGLGNS